MSEIEQLKNLILMAAADGSFSESEMLLLADRCHDLGLSTSDLRRALDDAAKGTAMLTIPSDHSERMALLRSLMRMMAADGKLMEPEKQLFAMACACMEFGQIEIDELIDQLLAEQRLVHKPGPTH